MYKKFVFTFYLTVTPHVTFKVIQLKHFLQMVFSFGRFTIMSHKLTLVNAEFHKHS